MNTLLDKWKINYYKKTIEEELIDSFKGKIIVLAGLPGVGKSTLGINLQRVLNGVYYPEYVQKDYLELYLKNPKHYGFGYQILMIRERLTIAIKAQEKAKQGYSVIIDGPLLCDNAFAKLLWKDNIITDEEYSIYQKIVDTEVNNNIINPDYLVYLNCYPEVALDRIKIRGRPGEDKYTYNFLCKLHNMFSEVLSDEKVNIINYDKNNLENDIIPKTTLLKLLELIRNRTYETNGLNINYFNYNSK